MSVIKGLLLILVAFELDTVLSSRILVVFPVPFRDHQVIFRPLIEELANRGHQLTVLTTDPQIFAHDREHIDIIDLSFTHNLKVLDQLKLSTSGSGVDVIRNVFHVMRTIAEAELKSPQVQEMLRNGDSGTFDAVLIDWSGPSLMNGFAHRFKVPLIGITPGGALTTSHEAMGNPNHPTLFPSVLLPFSDDLSLFQRIASAFFLLKYRYLYFNEELPIQHEIGKDYFGQDLPDLWELETKTDLLLVNSYQALGNSRPVNPTTVFLGGIHSTTIRKQLSRDLKNFMDESYNGIVYVNLGSNTLQAFIETERIDKFINILENSGYDIVWNLNNMPVIMNTTARLYQSPVMSQEDVLAHPNVRLFINPGLQQDIEDAIHNTIPVLGLSFSRTIERYLLQVQKYDVGQLSQFDLEPNTMIVSKVKEIGSNEKYKLNMLRLKQLVTDSPQTPRERAIWWIEYVIRHGGTQHLQSSWNKLSWLQYLLLDVVLSLTITAFLLITAIVVIVVKIRRYSKSLPVEMVTRRVIKAKLA